MNDESLSKGSSHVPISNTKLDRYLTFFEKNLFWIPYLTAAGLIVFDIQVCEFVVEHGFSSLVKSGKGLTRLLGLLVMTILATSQFVLCFRKTSRIKAIFSLTFAIIIIGAFLAIVEFSFPPIENYSRFQKSIQDQIKRRSTNDITEFCGNKIRTSANSLGWIDKERSYNSKYKRVVFIGDSFLETLSLKNVSERVEEELFEKNIPIEIINLSKTDTRPQPDYLHKFYEFAFEYNPEHIFLFIYSGNDLSTHFRYYRYHHPRYYVSDRTIEFLKEVKIDENVLKTLMSFNKRKMRFDSKQALFEQLKDANIDLKQMNLIYLTCLGYLGQIGASFSEKLFPNAITRFKTTRKEISNRLKAIKKSSVKKKPIDCAHISFDQTRNNYQLIFNKPLEDRLESIAKFIANDYCQTQNYDLYFDILKKQDSYFINQIINYPDAMGPLVSSVVGYAANGIKKKKIKANRVERASTEYVKLFSEFYNAAKNQSVGLTLIFIPVATNIDESFVRCWKPLRGKGKGDGRGPPMVKTIKSKIDGKIPFIDLTEFPNQFQGGYWIFDGHWNEKGNEAAAKIISDYIVSNSCGWGLTKATS